MDFGGTPLQKTYTVGATFTAGGNTQNVVDPSQNIEHGFWRIAYRGSDPKPVDNWQTSAWMRRAPGLSQLSMPDRHDEHF